jgi:cold shock CspA family protein
VLPREAAILAAALGLLLLGSAPRAWLDVRGRVAAFDAHRGYGTIAGDNGDSHFFHCTQIADGSRVIDIGAQVEYEVVAGHGGLWEAASITKCEGAIHDGHQPSRT